MESDEGKKQVNYTYFPFAINLNKAGNLAEKADMH